jgi:hypothetical protein
MGEHFFLTVNGVIGEIRSWRPRGCVRELDYRDSLFEKLTSSFPRTPPSKEFGHGRVKADIAFGTKIAIELKHDLDSPPKLQRLKGQLDDYARNFTNTIVVLTGIPQRDLIKDLKQAAKRFSYVFVVEK